MEPTVIEETGTSISFSTAHGSAKVLSGGDGRIDVTFTDFHDDAAPQAGFKGRHTFHLTPWDDAVWRFAAQGSDSTYQAGDTSFGIEREHWPLQEKMALLSEELAETFVRRMPAVVVDDLLDSFHNARGDLCEALIVRLRTLPDGARPELDSLDDLADRVSDLRDGPQLHALG